LQVWRNHEGLVQALLEAGADPNVQDSESGWSALHRALHFGQLRIAAALLQANANLSLPDWQGRAPLDLLSAELREFIEPGGDGDVFCFGTWLPSRAFSMQ
jgi:ankyrin repeat protein